MLTDRRQMGEQTRGQKGREKGGVQENRQKGKEVKGRATRMTDSRADRRKVRRQE